MKWRKYYKKGSDDFVELEEVLDVLGNKAWEFLVFGLDHEGHGLGDLDDLEL